jgi:Zn-dependent peptidase ImmA (M78 family)
MADVIDQILFSKQEKRFRKIEDTARYVSSSYSGTSVIRDGIFSVVKNYARKKEISLEIMRYPFHDDELWAFTFLKAGTIFVCVNSDLPICRQIFAMAHELYHIYCFGEDTDQNMIRMGSILKENTADSGTEAQEELEANAFAGALLMPAESVRRQMELMEIVPNHFELDDILTMMDIYALPYKACVLRLYECGVISAAKAKQFYTEDWKKIRARISLTGKAKRWVLDGKGTEQFGSLLENFAYNSENGFLTESREKSDKDYISSLQKKYNLDVEDL